MIRMVHPAFKELSKGALLGGYIKFLAEASNRPDRPDFAARQPWRGDKRGLMVRLKEITLGILIFPVTRGPPCKRKH